MKTSTTSNNYKKIIIIIGWILVWELISSLVHNSILMVGPFEVFITLLEKCGIREFWISIGASLLRIFEGFLVGSLAGIILAVIACKYELIADIFELPMAFLKSVPVASIVVLFLIWWHSELLAFAICICVVLPQIYVNLYQGLKNVDMELLEMSQVFHMHPFNRIMYIYRPSVRSYLEAAIKISVSMAWKSGVAAEVIGTPENSIGAGLYMSKIYLDTAGVLAWTTVIIVISILCEKAVMYIFNLFNECRFPCLKSNMSRLRPVKLCLEDLRLSFEDLNVLEDYSDSFMSGEPRTLDWLSGSGKTSLFRIISDLQDMDSGRVIYCFDDAQQLIVNKCDKREFGKLKPSVAYIFQEDRLAEEYSAVKNLEMVCGDSKKSRELLLELLSEEDIYKPVKNLSGGQKRRVAVARACVTDADIILADEPFNGLDEINRRKVLALLEDFSRDRICIIASHIE